MPEVARVLTFRRQVYRNRASHAVVARWQSLPHNRTHLSVEIEATEFGVVVRGHSPTMTTADAAALADALGEATVVHEMIGQGFSGDQIRRVLDTHAARGSA